MKVGRTNLGDPTYPYNWPIELTSQASEEDFSVELSGGYATSAQAHGDSHGTTVKED